MHVLSNNSVCPLFRNYDPQVGRFIVQDPIGLNGRWKLYQYAPNPLNYIDPLDLTATVGRWM
nr:RHS repeat-associated core domain-containing protein [Enterobacter sichuanensis]